MSNHNDRPYDPIYDWPRTVREIYRTARRRHRRPEQHEPQDRQGTTAQVLETPQQELDRISRQYHHERQQYEAQARFVQTLAETDPQRAEAIEHRTNLEARMQQTWNHYVQRHNELFPNGR